MHLLGSLFLSSPPESGRTSTCAPQTTKEENVDEKVNEKKSVK